MINVVQADLSLFRQNQQVMAEQVGSASPYDRIRKATRQALSSGATRGLESLVLPVINTNSWNYDPLMVAQTMVSEVRRHLSLGLKPAEITFLIEETEFVEAFNKMLERSRIVCLGDSITYGYPDGPSFSWVAAVSQKTGYEFINKGVSGETTGQMLARLATDVLSASPAYLILLGGANDGWQGIPVDEAKNNIETIVESALHNGICPMVGLPSPLNLAQLVENFNGTWDDALAYKNRLNQLRAWIITYARDHGILTLDFYTPLLDNFGEGNSELLLDGGHPTHEGYQKLAETLIDQMAGRLQL